MSEEQPYLPFSIRNKDFQSMPLQHGIFPRTVRNQFVHLARAFCGNPSTMDGFPGSIAPGRMWEIICKDTAFFAGEPSLGYNDFDGYASYLIQAPDEMGIEAVELAVCKMKAVAEALGEDQKPCYHDYGGEISFQTIVKQLNNCFYRARIGYRFLDSQIVEIESDLLYSEVTVPAVRLLAAADFDSALSEFMDGHKAIRDGDFANAIVKANASFESTMKLLCDAKGWPYDPERDTAKDLLDVVFEKGNVDRFQFESMNELRSALSSGLPTLRNKRGGHGAGTRDPKVDRHLARFALHLAAANIVFLIEAHEPFN